MFGTRYGVLDLGFRFLHTADWQLGKAFGQFDPDLAGELKAARRDAITRIAKLAHAREIEHVIVAGDVWDLEFPSASALIQPLDLMADAAPLQWWLMPGNHDVHRPGGLWSRVADYQPDNVHLLLHPGVTPLSLEVALLPAPWTQKIPGEDLTAWMDSATTSDGVLRIGVAHGGVKAFGSESAASAVIDDRRAELAGLSYLGLGDWHGYQDVTPKTWYSGTPEPDRFVKNARGFVLEVELTAPDAPPNVTAHSIGHFNWQSLEMDIASSADFDALNAALSELGTAGRTLVKLSLSGRVTLTERSELLSRLDVWKGRLTHLDLRLDDLQTLVSTDDIDRLEAEGSVRRAAESLRLEIEASENPASRIEAERALQFLFSYAQDKTLAGQ